MASARIAIAACLTLAGAAVGQLQPTYSNLAYGTHARQKLDIYIPSTGVAPRPLVVWIHGGGWQSGDKYPAPKAPILVNAGFVVASLNYRLSSDATFPAQINDCKGAFRWLRAHAAEYGIDPCRVGVWGSSAGGHLAALVGTSGNVASLEGEIGGNLAYSSRVQATADYYGPTDLLNMYPSHDPCDSPESKMLGVCLADLKAHISEPAWADELALVISAGPINHVTVDDPPFHIDHGTADPVVPPAQSQALYDALTSVGVPAALRWVQGAGHGLPASEDPFVRDFFVAQLGNPRPPADLDCNGRIDLVDYAELAACLAGPAIDTPPLDCDPVAAGRADHDHDGDIDLGDFAAWARASTLP